MPTTTDTDTAAPFEVRPITAEETRPLRRAVLRPHQRLEELTYPGDGVEPTLHVGAFVQGALLGVASLYHEPRPGQGDPKGWRLRGMAVTPAAQGQGLGAALLRRLIAHAEAHGGVELWCNARTPAAGFYRKLGFTAEGAEFELPGIGPHYVMSLPLGGARG